MVVARLVEGDQLEVGAVAKGDQAVVGADARVTAAGHDGEAEVAVVLGGGVEIPHGDDEVIDPEQHQRPP